MTTTETPARPTLPDDAAPCRSCGVVVRDADPRRVEVLTIYGPPLFGGQGARAWERDVRVTRCDVCAKRHARAAELVALFPAVGRALGDVAIDKLDSALAALDASGDPRGKLTRHLKSAQEAYDLITELAPLGGACNWAAVRLSPGAFESRRWGHVGGQLVADIREVHRALLRRPFETSGPVVPPERASVRGCLFCGVGSITVRESKAWNIWGDELRVPLAVFGAGGGVLSGHLCPECRDDFEAVGGAFGYPAVWRSVMRFRGYVLQAGRTVQTMGGVVPFAALPMGRTPNATRWQHLDLAGIDRMLGSSPDVRKVAE